MKYPVSLFIIGAVLLSFPALLPLLPDDALARDNVLNVLYTGAIKGELEKSRLIPREVLLLDEKDRVVTRLDASGPPADRQSPRPWRAATGGTTSWASPWATRFPVTSCASTVSPLSRTRSPR